MGGCDDYQVTDHAAATPATIGTPTAQDEVAALCSDLIRIDTTNPGDNSGPGERAAAEHVAAILAGAGLEPTILESDPTRASVVARWEGTDPARPALLIHGHLDVVPADAADWQIHPFSGEIKDGCVWGRGAVDMKDMDAMMLAVLRQRTREGRRPPRDVVLVFPADEEAGGKYGARFLVDEHKDLFEGVTEAIGEVGGFSTTIGGRRLYPLQTAEKGMAWMRLTAQGTPATAPCSTPTTPSQNSRKPSPASAATSGPSASPPPSGPSSPKPPKPSASSSPPISPRRPRQARPHHQDGRRHPHQPVNPSVLKAGYKVNVVPQHAQAQLDGRFLPGHEDEFLAEVDSLLSGGVRREFIHHDIAVETSFDGALCDAMTGALLAEDPDARVVPYCLSAGTDAKSFSRLGIRCFGFTPLQLPAAWTSLACSTGSTSASRSTP